MVAQDLSSLVNINFSEFFIVVLQFRQSSDYFILFNIGTFPVAILCSFL